MRFLFVAFFVAEVENQGGRIRRKEGEKNEEEGAEGEGKGGEEEAEEGRGRGEEGEEEEREGQGEARVRP